MNGREQSALVKFFIRYKTGQFADRRMYIVPRAGDICVFNDFRYRVDAVEWCLDLDATAVGILVNIELSKIEV